MPIVIKTFKLSFILLIITILISCKREKEKLLLSDSFFNLKGKPTQIIFHNSTHDTIKLNGLFFNTLPYDEHNFKLIIPPTEYDTLTLQFNYPDFIQFIEPNYLRIFNGPGKELYCDFKDTKAITFKGEYAGINDYYQSYHQKLGWRYEQNRIFYLIADTLKTMNEFPKLADSVNQISLKFLENYNKPLPNWFKNHETQRLNFLTNHLKYNALDSKQFYTSEEIKVNKNYYNFERYPLYPEDMILNTDYLFYIDEYISKKYKKIVGRNSNLVSTIYWNSLIDSLFKRNELGDILKIRYLTYAFKGKGKMFYDSLLIKTNFINSKNKFFADSSINAIYGVPIINEPMPKIVLKSLDGEFYKLDDFKENYIILNFWATNCGPCIKEFPAEDELYQKFKTKKLTVINVCLDSAFPDWIKTLNKFKSTVINVYAESKKDYNLKNKFGINSFPKSILLKPGLIVIDNNFPRASLINVKDLEKILKK